MPTLGTKFFYLVRARMRHPMKPSQYEKLIESYRRCLYI